MADKTVTRAELSKAVRQTLRMSELQSTEYVEQVLEGICECLATGDDVQLSGFGTFTVRHKGERVGRNPKTKVEAPIKPRRVVAFRPSFVLKARINGETAEGGD